MTDASIKLGIDSRSAKAGESEFRRSADSIKQAALSMAQSVDKAASIFDKMASDIRKASPAVQKMTAEQKALKKIIEDTLTPMEKYQRKMAELTNLRGFAKTEQEVQALNRAMNQAQRESGGFINGLRNGMNQIISLAGPFAAAFSLQSLVQAGSDMQGLRARLEGLTGSAENAAEAMEFLRQTAALQKVDLLDVSDAYGRLLPSVDAGVLSMGEMREILRLTNDSIKAFQLGTGEAQGVFLGLSQLLGSGTVTMEDLRQVTDRMPGTISRLAAATGMTVAELKKMVATGTLTAEQLKGPLIEAMEKNAGAAKKLGATLQSVVIDFKNTWRDFGDTLSNTGVLHVTSKIIQLLSFSFKGLSLAVIGARIEFNLLTGDKKEAMELDKKFQKLKQEEVVLAETILGLNKENRSAQTGLASAIDKNTKLLKADAEAKATSIKMTEELKKKSEQLANQMEETNLNLVLQIQKMKLDPSGENNLASQLAEVEDKAYRNAAAFKALGKEGKNLLETTKMLTIEQYNLEKAQERSKKAAEEMTKAIDHAWENIQDAAADAVLKFDGDMDAMVDIAKKAGAEMATALIIKPALAQGAGFALNSLGFAQTAFQVSGGAYGSAGGAAGGAAGGSGTLSNLSSGASLLSNFSGGGGFATTALDKFGSLFGIGNSNFIGPMQNGGLAGGLSQYSSFTNGSFGGGLGASAGGFIGNLGANAVFGADRGIGANIGGSIGAIAGSFIPVPILGPIIGSFIGNAIGGLFGNNKPSSKLQAGNVDLTTGILSGRTGLGGVDPNNPGKKFSKENYDAVTSLAAFAAQISNTLSGGAGINKTLGIEVGNRNGLGFKLGEGELQSFGQDKGKFIEGLIKALVGEIPNISKNIETAVKNIDFADTEKALKDLDFALAFDNLDFAPKKATALEEAMKNLNEQVDEAAKRAKRLGLEEKKVFDARDKQVGQLRSDFNASIKARSLGITDPRAAAINNLDAEFTGIRRDAFAIGGDLAAVEKLYGLERVKIAEQYAQDATAAVKSQYDDIRKFRESIMVSSTLSGLSVENRRSTALNQLAEVKVRYASGEATFNDVQESINTLLDASKAYFGFSEGYYKDQAAQLDYLSSIESDAKKAFDVQAAALGESKTQTGLLQEIAKGVSSQLVGAGGISANDARLFRASDDKAAIAKAFNTKNQLPELLVRQLKVQSGFNFNDPANADRTYAQFAQTNPAALKIFNQLVSAVGGLPQFANGGSFNAGMAIVGERGPELVNFEASGRVLSNGETRAALSGSSSGNSGSDSSAVVAALQDAIEEIRALREQSALQSEQMQEMAMRLGGIEKTANRQSQRRVSA